MQKFSLALYIYQLADRSARPYRYIMNLNIRYAWYLHVATWKFDPKRWWTMHAYERERERDAYIAAGCELESMGGAGRPPYIYVLCCSTTAPPMFSRSLMNETLRWEGEQWRSSLGGIFITLSRTSQSNGTFSDVTLTSSRRTQISNFFFWFTCCRTQLCHWFWLNQKTIVDSSYP